MRLPRIYLETTIFNACFDTDAPDNTRCALALFAAIERGNYTPYTSVFTVNELLLAGDEKKAKMLRLIDDHSITVLERTDDVDVLAEAYIEQGIIPAKYATDGFHIAIASVHEMDIIFSYNFKHIVKEKTRVLTKIVNEEKGFRGIVISSPKDVFLNE